METDRETEFRPEDERFRAHACNNCMFLTWWEARSGDVILLLFPICEVSQPYMLATLACTKQQLKRHKGQVTIRRIRGGDDNGDQ